MEPYIAENEAGTSKFIITIVDPTSGRWPSPSIYGLCKIARKCLEPKYTDRGTIAEVCKLSEGVAII